MPALLDEAMQARPGRSQIFTKAKGENADDDGGEPRQIASQGLRIKLGNIETHSGKP